jgi:hypothetical protein
MPLEAAFWLGAMAVLGIWGADLHGHASFCIPSAMGWDGCMGCGVGHAMGLTLRGDVESAAWTHFMGIPAVGILLYRSIHLIIHSNRRGLRG